MRILQVQIFSHLVGLVLAVNGRVASLRQRNAMAGVAGELVRVTVGEGEVDKVAGLQPADALVAPGVRARVVGHRGGDFGLDVCQLPLVAADRVGELGLTVGQLQHLSGEPEGLDAPTFVRSEKDVAVLLAST